MDSRMELRARVEPLDSLGAVGVEPLSAAEMTSTLGGLVWPWEREYWTIVAYIVRPLPSEPSGGGSDAGVSPDAG